MFRSLQWPLYSQQFYWVDDFSAIHWPCYHGSSQTLWCSFCVWELLRWVSAARGVFSWRPWKEKLFNKALVSVPCVSNLAPFIETLICNACHFHRQVQTELVAPSRKIALRLREALEDKNCFKPHFWISSAWGEPQFPGVKLEGACSGREGRHLKQDRALQTKQAPALCPCGYPNLKDIAACAWFLLRLRCTGLEGTSCVAVAPLAALVMDQLWLSL